MRLKLSMGIGLLETELKLVGEERNPVFRAALCYHCVLESIYGERILQDTEKAIREFANKAIGGEETLCCQD